MIENPVKLVVYPRTDTSFLGKTCYAGQSAEVVGDIHIGMVGQNPQATDYRRIDIHGADGRVAYNISDGAYWETDVGQEKADEHLAIDQDGYAAHAEAVADDDADEKPHHAKRGRKKG